MNLALLRGLTSTNRTIVSSGGNTNRSTPAAQPQSQTQTQADAVFTPSTSNQTTNDLSRFRAAQLLITPPVENTGGPAIQTAPVTSSPASETASNPSPAPAQNTNPATNPIPPSNRATSQALDLLNGSFEAVDTSGDGFLSESEIATFQSQQGDLSSGVRQALGQVAEAVPELMFTSIEEGDDAYFGIGREDILATNAALREGESLSQIQDRIADVTAAGSPFVRALAQLQGGGNREAHRQFVSVARRAILRRREAGVSQAGGG